MRQLERRLTAISITAVSISAMIGSGIFVLPGIAAGKTGPSVWLAYAVAGLGVLPAALSTAELATAMPTSGGTYLYLDRAFGPLTGTVTGLGVWLSLLLKSSFALVGLGAYLLVLVDLPLKPTAVLLLCTTLIINIRGVSGVGMVQMVLTGICLASLALLSAVGVFKTDVSHFDAFFHHGAFGFLGAVGFVTVSYAGVTKVSAIAEEVRRPERNLPIGILVSLLIVTIAYAAISLIMVGCLSLDSLGADLHPIYSLGAFLGGPFLGIPAAVIGVLTMTSMANAGLLAASRIPFAMARDDLMPRGIGSLHKRFLTPMPSILLSGAVMAVVIVFLDVERIANLASSFIIMTYLAENLTVIVLRESGVQWYRPAYKSPMYPWAQLVGIVWGLLLLLVMGIFALAAALAIIMPGVLLYIGYGRRRSARLGVVGQRGPRQELVRERIPTVRISHDDEDVDGQAAVLVPLFGIEKSAEALVEVGAALSGGGKIDVVHMTNVPEQTTLDAIIDNAPKVSSLRRRIGAMAQTQGWPITFDAIASRDIIKRVHRLSNELQCRWLVMEWAGRARGSFTVRNPLGWLKDHVGCNLALFHDAGVRYIRKILVTVEPGSHDSLVANTADQLARVHDADLTFVRFVHDNAPRTQAACEADYLDQVRQLCQAKSEVVLVRGQDGARAIGETSAAYDLLVTGERPLGSPWRRIIGTGSDRLTQTAACSVLRVQSPRGSTHATVDQERLGGTAGELRVSEVVESSCIGVSLERMRKDALFTHFARTFSACLENVEPTPIIDALWERERAQNTSVGMGLALPHATLPGLDRTYLAVFTTQGPIAYAAPDGQDVDVFFVTLGTPSDRQTHLVLLSAISKLVMQTSVLDRLRAAEDPEQVLAVLRACEGELRKP